MSDTWFEVGEVTDVVAADGTPIGRLRPNKPYRALAVGPIQVDVAGPGGTVGHVPRAAINVVAPSAPSVPTAPPPAPKRGSRWTIAAVVLALLLIGAGAALYLLNRQETIDDGWWLHQKGSGRYFDDPALDMSMLVLDGSFVDQAQASYDNGTTCFNAVASASTQYSDKSRLILNMTGETCAGIPIDVYLSMGLNDDGDLTGSYDVDTAEENGGASLYSTGFVDMVHMGGPGTSDPFGGGVVAEITDFNPPGRPTIPKVAVAEDGPFGGQPATGQQRIEVCPDGSVTFESDQTVSSSGEKASGLGGGTVSPEGEGTLETSFDEFPGGPTDLDIPIRVSTTFVTIVIDGTEQRLTIFSNEEALTC